MNPSMQRALMALKRPWIWLYRFRHRRGYGVHSPYAFNYIKGVIYETGIYYKYKDLEAEQRRLAPEKGKRWANEESRKLKRLLFRMANHACAHTVIDVGPATAAGLYLRAARESADYLQATDPTGLFLESGVPVDFLYLHDEQHPERVKQVFEVCASRTTGKSVFAVRGIHSSPTMKRLWQSMQQDGRVGVTFDLYDLGILCFDRSKNKQDYVVNFVNY